MSGSVGAGPPARAIELPARIDWGRLPTPLDALEETGRELGVELLLKREDLLDDLGCGHKVRKLAYVGPAAAAAGATVLVTVGSVPSSQCVAVAALARRLGIRSHLVYTGDQQARPERAQGSYLVASLLRPTLSWHERSPWTEHVTHLARAVTREREAGERPYVVRPSIVDWPGLAGSIELGLELVRELAALGPRETWVIAPAGSGGTCLGVHIAARLLGVRLSVAGVCIGGPADVVAQSSRDLLVAVPPPLGSGYAGGGEVLFHDGALGAGYDAPRPAELETMREMLYRHGIVFDPNYMVKAFLGLRQLVAAGTIPRGARVVLVHTGGALGLFGEAPALRAWYERELSALETGAGA